MWFPPADGDDIWAGAVKHLSKVDPVMKRIIKSVGPCTLRPRKDYFVVLCQSIFSQQISTAVATVLFNRFRRNFPQQRPTPRRVVEYLETADEAVIRGCGISRQKHAYLLDLARHFDTGRLPTSRFVKMDDEALIEALDGVRGIGRWTAEMFLIFTLNRTDVLPVDDLGVVKGFQTAYELPEMPKPAAMRTLAEPWRPYRSIGTWYLWRMPKADPKTKIEDGG